MGLPSLDIQIKYLQETPPMIKVPQPKLKPIPKPEEKKYMSRKAGDNLETKPVIPKAEIRLNKGAIMLAEFNTKRFNITKDMRKYDKDLI